MNYPTAYPAVTYVKMRGLHVWRYTANTANARGTLAWPILPYACVTPVNNPAAGPDADRN